MGPVPRYTYRRLTKLPSTADELRRHTVLNRTLDVTLGLTVALLFYLLIWRGSSAEAWNWKGGYVFLAIEGNWRL